MRGRDAFCNREVISGEIYYETKHTFVLYNIRPILPGHSLIIPKRHVEDFAELTGMEVLDMFAVIKKIRPALLKRYGCNSYNLTAQIGRNSGMTVNHFHFHLIPRKSGDRYRNDDNRIYDRLYGKVRRMSAKRKWIVEESAALRRQLASK